MNDCVFAKNKQKMLILLMMSLSTITLYDLLLGVVPSIRISTVIEKIENTPGNAIQKHFCLKF